MYRFVYILLVGLLSLFLLVGFIYEPLFICPWYFVGLVLLFSVYGFLRERSFGLAWFFPVVLFLFLVWWGYVCSDILPYLLSLDYSWFNIFDVSVQVFRARVALLFMSLLLLLGYCYVYRDGIFELMSSGLCVFSNIFRGLFVSDSDSVREDSDSDRKLCEVREERRLSDLGYGCPGEDLVVCYTESGEPVKLSDKDRYLHMLVVGPTGVGKTSRILKPMIEQELCNIRNSMVRGVPRGMTVIEPKGDLALDVAKMARYYGVPLVYIDPLRSDSCRFNPLEGDPSLVAEATRTVLRATFGKQQAFFGLVQEIAARNTVLLLKYRYRDDVTMQHMLRLLRDHSLLREEVNGLREFMDDLDGRIVRAEVIGDERELEWLYYLRSNRSRIDDLITYFDVEVLSERMGEKIQQFALGLRLQVDDLTGNEYLGPVLGGRSDINLDVHLSRGGVLVVNTAMGVLGKLGDAFGQFIVMHFQNAVFRREESESDRARHMLVIDEAHRYINPDFERLLAMGRSYCCECVLALQSTSQLLLDEHRMFRDNVLGSCRNKVVFGGMDSDEAKYFSREFGESLSKRVDVTHDASILFDKPWSGRKVRVSDVYEQRFDYTTLMELPAFHVVYRLVKDNAPQLPGIGKTELSSWDKCHRDSDGSLGLSITVDDDVELPSVCSSTDVVL